MEYLVHDSTKLVKSARHGPRVKSEGDPNYTLDQGEFIQRLC